MLAYVVLCTSMLSYVGICWLICLACGGCFILPNTLLAVVLFWADTTFKLAHFLFLKQAVTLRCVYLF